MSQAGKKSLPEESVQENITTYLKGVRAEWEKITWPEKRQVFVEVIIVLAVVLFFTVLVFFYDLLFNWILGLIF